MSANERTRAVYIISVAAELTGVHPQTLRVYERKGLVAPARTGGMSRRYSESDLDKIRRVLELTNEGLNLAGVTRVLDLEAQLSQLQAKLAEATNRVEQSTALVPFHQSVAVSLHASASAITSREPTTPASTSDT